MEIIQNVHIDFEKFKKELTAGRENKFKIIDNLYQYIKLIELRKKSDKSEYIVRYIKYWGFNTNRLSMDFLVEYFKKLINCEELPFRDMVLSSNGKQLSFATKMQHTFDCEKPIYDSKVKTLLKIKKMDIEIYNRYCEEFHRLLKKYVPELDALREFLSNIEAVSPQEEYIKENILNKQKIGDTKLMDSVIWFLGKLEDKQKRLGKY